MQEVKLRHELKHYINYSDWMQLKSRLKFFATADENAGPNGGYRVRSLYFDNYRDKALVEKLSGVSRREKFRLRYYNDDTAFIRLEKKGKVKRMVSKEQAQLSREACRRLISGDYGVLLETGDALCAELCEKMRTQQLRPRAIVDYHREAYVYAPGNVRITVDSNIRTSGQAAGFLNPKSVTIPSANAIVLEIKYEEFMPDIIRDLVQLGSRRETEFSKYVVSRLIT